MSRDTPLWRRWVALHLLGALPALAVAIPLLDLMASDGRPGVETHHHPGTHGFPHNHLICIQQQADQWAPSSDPGAPPEVLAPDGPAPLGPVVSAIVAPVELPRPRAPPAA